MIKLVVISALLSLAVPAGADVSEAETLRGLDGVMVIVERLHPDAERIGLDRETLDAEVRSRLQAAGVGILSPSDRSEHERRPYLYVNCNVMYLEDIGLVSFSIDVEVHQRVTLADGEHAQALTWAKSYLGVQSRDHAAAQIRHVLAGYVAEFIRDRDSASSPEHAEAALPG